MIDRIRTEVDKKENYDFRGEEGLLYRVPVDGQAFWAKKWHRSHNKNFYMPLESGGSSLSPFWHRAVRLSYSIVHELFPNETIDVIGSYDERTGSNLTAIHNFEPLSGKPVTVSREVVGDPELCAIRDEIMASHYKVLLAGRDDGARRGATKAQMEPFFAAGRKEVNARIVAALGPEIDLDSLIASLNPNGPEVLDQLAKKIRGRNPKNVMADLYDAGISPGHPELNFVPGTRDTHPNPPHGTFVEFSIADSRRLVEHINKKLAHNPRKRDELLGKFRSYEIYSLIDQLYDKIFLAYVQKTSGRGEPDLLGKICLTLERFRQIIERFGLAMDPEMMGRSVIDIISSTNNPGKAVSRLQIELITPMERALA